MEYKTAPTHPAKYTDSFIPIFARLLKGCDVVLDPFGGTGKINRIKAFGFSGKIICNEIEPDFAKLEDKDCICFVDKWNIGDAEKMDFLNDKSVDAICTSPTYGNRMADHFKTNSNRKYMTYTHCIGHDLNDGNTGKMQYGEAYREKHLKIYKECSRVCKDGGKFICNVSNFIRGGVEIDVVSFHKEALQFNGFKIIETISIPTRRMGFGQNREQRVQHEEIMVFEKGVNVITEDK